MTFVAATAIFALGCGSEPPALPNVPIDGSVDGQVPLASGQILPGVWVAGTTSGGQRQTYFIDLPSAGKYVIEGAAPWLTFDLQIYSDAGRSNLIAECDFVGSVNDGCTLALGAGRRYVTLVPDPLGGSFSFVITPIVNEGSEATPAGTGPTETVRHTVDSAGVSHFRFQATTAGAYDLRFVDFGVYDPHLYSSLRLEAYRGEGYGGELLGTCQSGQIPQPPCRLSGVPSGPVSIRVVPFDPLPGVFSLAPVRGLGEGAAIEPVPLGTSTHDGGVDEWSLSYYAFTPSRDGVTRLEFTGNPVVEVDLYVDAVSTTPFTTCVGPICSLSGLSVGTNYVGVARALFGSAAPYTVTVVPGLGVGTPTSRASFPVGTATDVVLDEGGTSYFRATLPESGYYRFETSSFTPGDTVVLTYPSDTYPTTRTCTLSTTSICDVGPRTSSQPLDFQIRSADGGTVRLTLIEEPVGEGVAADPVEVGFDALRSVDVHPTYDSYYRFTAGPSGGDYEVLFFTPQSLDTTFEPFNVAQCQGTETTRICTLRNLTANQVVDFHIGPYGTATGPLAVQFVITAQATSGGCEVGSLVCHDFESGAVPAGFSEPASSVRPFRVLASAALSGAYGYGAGAMSPSCFTFDVGADAHAVSFDHEIVSSQTSDSLDVRIDGYLWSFLSATTTPTRRRTTVPVIAGTPHTLELCFDFWGAGAYAYVDDISVR